MLLLVNIKVFTTLFDFRKLISKSADLSVILFFDRLILIIVEFEFSKLLIM